MIERKSRINHLWLMVRKAHFFLLETVHQIYNDVNWHLLQCSQICSPFDKNQFPSERRKHVEEKKFDKIKIKNIESKHKIS
jgi:hypothetical protein